MAGDAALTGGTLAVALAVVLAFGVHVDPGRTLQNPIERSDASVASGELLFATSCSQCRGMSGGGDGVLAGTLPTPPENFRVHVPFHADGVLFTWITDGVRGTGMPAWKDVLSEQERWNLVNFLRASFDQPVGGDSKRPGSGGGRLTGGGAPCLAPQCVFGIGIPLSFLDLRL